MKIYNKTVRIKKFINKITKKKVLKTINNHCIINLLQCNMGGKVPKSFYLSNRKQEEEDDED